jgi:hypothetical protein
MIRIKKMKYHQIINELIEKIDSIEKEIASIESTRCTCSSFVLQYEGGK